MSHFKTSQLPKLDGSCSDLPYKKSSITFLNSPTEPDFPWISPELTDNIIDFLSSDPLSLKRTSLVCRLWLPRSRFHLFSTVRLELIKLRRINKFLQLISSSHCTIHIGTLVISARILPLEWTSEYPDVAASVHSILTVPGLCRALSHASSLVLDHFDTTKTCLSFSFGIEAISRTFTNVQSITFKRIRFKNSAHMMYCAQSFPSATKWTCSKVTFVDGDDTTDHLRGCGVDSVVQTSALHTVVLDDVPGCVYEWFFLHEHDEKTMCMDTLSATLVADDRLPFLRGMLLSQIGSRLTVLEISFLDQYISRQSDFAPSSQNLPDFSRLTQLRSLRLCDISIDIVPGAYRKAIPRLLSQIRSPLLEEVYFECTTFALPHRPTGGKKYLANRSWIHNFLDWDLLAVVLARNQFGDLRKLCFVCPSYYGARFVRLVCRKLEDCPCCGVVSVIESGA
ncbi:uncharacterized protein BT62DRAFT_933922 [Guyanagaster necrorhizus]|uniref:F-box domain-containing protein n=1 Tax=Guyanagaster necrorhizus TaxID=856835 RepID=A0A9P8ARG6_9AGAR|nr:uncharacterized protein BT62DRAFT_933922 [Guyanagaster necrorhizus MCA 3950]KAG7444876.1 hypothetical protein BT62DRAFT_933922 [Guyanagaster necrorhizus MCA 3950]